MQVTLEFHFYTALKDPVIEQFFIAGKVAA